MENSLQTSTPSPLISILMIGPFQTGKTTLTQKIVLKNNPSLLKIKQFNNLIHKSQLHGGNKDTNICDHFLHERVRNLTIFQRNLIFQLENENRSFSITDTPGHPKYFRNMMMVIHP